MQKKLAAELTDLAHSILRMNDKEDVLALKNKAGELYEKLSVLAYIDYYVDTTPQATETKEEILTKVEKIDFDTVTTTITQEKNLPEQEHILDDNNTTLQVTENTIEEEAEIEPLTISFNDDDSQKFDETTFIEDIKQAPTLEEELKDTLSVDVTADLFTKADTQKSLNDYLQRAIQIGLNDRIAFVKHLFNGDQSDFNRVISQLNTMDNEKEAKKFITKTIKPEYDWSDKEEYETRFMEIVERRFN